MSEKQNLPVLISNTGLEKDVQERLLLQFQNFEQTAAEWKKTADGLVITRTDQVAEMAMARQGRLFLREKRIEVEKTRKKLKEASLKEGKAIDEVAKYLTGLIEPIEKDLDKKERFVEIQQELAIAKLKADRWAICTPLMEYFPDEHVPLESMTTEGFEAFVRILKKKEEHKIEEDARIKLEEEAARKVAEEERIKQAKAAEKLKAENERLRKELANTKKTVSVLAEPVPDTGEDVPMFPGPVFEDSGLPPGESVATDRDKLDMLSTALKNYPLPRLDGGAANAIVDNVRILLNKVSAYIDEKSQTINS